jgi:hypothetical protein
MAEAINAIKNQALGAISNASGLSNDALNAGLETVKNISGGGNPIETLQKAITNLSKNKNVSSNIIKGAEGAVETALEPIVENFKEGANQASQKFNEPLINDQIIQSQINILIISRNITFGIIIFWGIVIFLRKYTSFLSETQKEYIDEINLFMHTYSTVFILLIVIYLIFSIPIYGLPYLGTATDFFNKLNQAIQIILSSLGGNILG